MENTLVFFIATTVLGFLVVLLYFIKVIGEIRRTNELISSSNKLNDEIKKVLVAISNNQIQLNLSSETFSKSLETNLAALRNSVKVIEESNVKSGTELRDASKNIQNTYNSLRELNEKLVATQSLISENGRTLLAISTDFKQTQKLQEENTSATKSGLQAIEKALHENIKLD